MQRRTNSNASQLEAGAQIVEENMTSCAGRHRALPRAEES